MSKPVILTGLRTNAEYHLGNYLGAILPMIELQKAHLGEYQINMFAPDLHSFTTEIKHGELFSQTMHNLRVFAAAGMPLDNPDFYMYRQSFIPAHSELTVILNNFTNMGELRRMVQFKDKIKLNSEQLTEKVFEYMVDLDFEVEDILKKYFSAGEFDKALDSIQDHFQKFYTGYYENEELNKSVASAGLFDYPVLMAADILLYRASYIPVGEDQRQHLELTRDLAIRLNNKFDKELFVVPEEWAKQLEFSKRHEGVRIRSLRNPSAKMSKSIDDPSGTIQLSDTPEVATKKIKTAETDSVGSIHWDWVNQPGITNLLQIYQLLSGKTTEEVTAEWEGNERYGDLKNTVAEHVAAFLTEFQANLQNVDEEQLHRKLEHSEDAMNEVANETLHNVQIAVGLRG